MAPEVAVARAIRTVKIPSLVAMFAPWIGYFLLSKLRLISTLGFAGLQWFAPAFAGGFVAGWLVWSIQVPRWRRWAYRHVDDIDALKREAVAAHILWPEGHFFERTEIAPRRLRRELEALETAKRHPSAAGGS